MNQTHSNKMKFYFFCYYRDEVEDEAMTWEYFTSITKLKKARAKYKREDYDFVGTTIFMTHVKPTKQGILRALNGQGGEVVEGSK